MFDKVKLVNQGLERRFPNGKDPFQIMTRILEEGGELAQQVNHFEGSGSKRHKYGGPDRVKLAGEVKGLLLAAMQVVDYYGLEKELEESLDQSIRRLREQGFLE
ncbi:MAG: hypothetical protein FJ319_00980 [SAR202 cluster bacterium]|nr:hypothetical protein [SAR202 cluster bacterium]